jgi:hypothetical protein
VLPKGAAGAGVNVYFGVPFTEYEFYITYELFVS